MIHEGLFTLYKKHKHWCTPCSFIVTWTRDYMYQLFRFPFSQHWFNISSLNWHHSKWRTPRLWTFIYWPLFYSALVFIRLHCNALISTCFVVIRTVCCDPVGFFVILSLRSIKCCLCNIYVLANLHDVVWGFVYLQGVYTTRLHRKYYPTTSTHLHGPMLA